MVLGSPRARMLFLYPNFGPPPWECGLCIYCHLPCKYGGIGSAWSPECAASPAACRQIHTVLTDLSLALLFICKIYFKENFKAQTVQTPGVVSHSDGPSPPMLVCASTFWGGAGVGHALLFLLALEWLSFVISYGVLSSQFPWKYLILFFPYFY